MTATAFDLIQIQTDATDYKSAFRTLIGAGTSSFDGAYAFAATTAATAVFESYPQRVADRPPTAEQTAAAVVNEIRANSGGEAN